MIHEENIQDMKKKCLTHIMNHMRTMDKTFPNENFINKVLICLNCMWKSKVIVIF